VRTFEVRKKEPWNFNFRRNPQYLDNITNKNKNNKNKNKNNDKKKKKKKKKRNKSNSTNVNNKQVLMQNMHHIKQKGFRSQESELNHY